MPSDPIVAGTDGSTSAELSVDRAGDLGQALDACVHVVSAFPSVSAGEWMAAAGGVAVLERSDAERAQEAESIVAKSRERLIARGINVRTRACCADPGKALLATAADEHAQMIVVGNRGMTGTRRLLGSVANNVSHHARCGVLIASTRSRSRPGEVPLIGGAIVVGTDGSDGARAAVRESIRLTNALGGALHIASSHPDSRVDAVLDEAVASAQAEGVIATRHASKRDPTEALLDVAEHVDAAIVIVGSKGMHGMDRLTLGNVPNRISHKGLCNVLIVYTGEPIGGPEERVAKQADVM